MDSLISVLLPFYNADSFLKKCLLGIQSQSYRSFEVIAVDDGSTDSGAEVYSKIAAADERFKLIQFPENRGIVTALNAGLGQCRGEWIARIDADDVMHPRRLELQQQHMLSHPQIDVLGCCIQLFRFEGDPSPGQLRYQNWSNSLLSDWEIKSNIFAESPIMHPTFFANRNFFQSFQGYRDNPWPEDYDLLLRAYLKGASFAKLPQVLVDKGDHPLRLARTDERCKRKAMFRAKAFYFKKAESLRQNRKLYIAGTGSSGKMTLQTLQKEGLSVDGVIDNSKQEVERSFQDTPVFSITKKNAAQTLSKLQRPLFLLCIGANAGRLEVEALLQRSGFHEGKDYLRFI